MGLVVLGLHPKFPSISNTQMHTLGLESIGHFIDRIIDTIYCIIDFSLNKANSLFFDGNDLYTVTTQGHSGSSSPSPACFGSLSCQNLNFHFGPSLCTLSLSSRTSLYLAPFILPLVLSSSPICATRFHQTCTQSSVQKIKSFTDQSNNFFILILSTWQYSCYSVSFHLATLP